MNRTGALGVAVLWVLVACSGAAPPALVASDAGPSTDDAGTMEAASADAASTPDASLPDAGAAETGGGDPIRGVFDSVSKSQIQARLLELTGATPVTVNGSTFRITDRWSPTAKAHFREYFTQYFGALGIPVNTIPFPVADQVGETEGHDVEAVLPGQSADSVVIIVHYDSVGITGQETQNPAADDDGSGTAMMLEAARIFAALPYRAHTLRFVGADYEEITNLQGDAAYVSYLQNEAQTKGFQILVASDNDQTGWSCWSEGLCGSGAPAKNTSLLMISCSGDSYGYDYPALRTGFKGIASAYSTMNADYSCDGSGDTDHYSFWQAGIPAYVIEEYGSGNNPHFDDQGDDTMMHIDLDYLLHIAQIQIAFQAKLVGVTP